MTPWQKLVDRFNNWLDHVGDMPPPMVGRMRVFSGAAVIVLFMLLMAASGALGYVLIDYLDLRPEAPAFFYESSEVDTDPVCPGGDIAIPTAGELAGHLAIYEVYHTLYLDRPSGPPVVIGGLPQYVPRAFDESAPVNFDFISTVPMLPFGPLGRPLPTLPPDRYFVFRVVRYEYWPDPTADPPIVYEGVARLRVHFELLAADDERCQE